MGRCLARLPRDLGGVHVAGDPLTVEEISVLVEQLDLPEFETHAELIWLLQERRGLQRDSIAARLPDEMPTATTVRLRASQRREIDLCEHALDALGAPYVAPNLEEDE
jgi:hypothetical protein